MEKLIDTEIKIV